MFENRSGDEHGNVERDFIEMVQLLLTLNSGGSCLDVGAGIERITGVAKSIVKSTVALEPDESRWKACHADYNEAPHCEVICQSTTDYIGESRQTIRFGDC